MNATPFWIDGDYDRANADTGTSSRYGNYLRQHDRAFTEIWYDDPAVEFAAIAWRVATGPIMAPPLVRRHSRIAAASVTRSDWNGELIADVNLISPRPQALANARTASGTWYHDQRLNAWDEYEGVSEQDLVRGAFMLTEVRLLWQLPAGTAPALTEVPAAGLIRYRACTSAVTALVRALNREVAPVLERLENGGGAR